MTRRLALLFLLLGAIVGVVLVFTASEDVLEQTTTVDGVEVDIPVGWERSEALPFEYRPPADQNRLTDRWLVAWACPDDCRPRSLSEWRSIGRELATFVNAREVEGTLLFDLVETEGDRSRVITARTQAGETQVFVAVFFDGADHYVECGLSVFDDVDGLADRIVEACLDAQPPGQ